MDGAATGSRGAGGRQQSFRVWVAQGLRLYKRSAGVVATVWPAEGEAAWERRRLGKEPPVGGDRRRWTGGVTTEVVSDGGGGGRR